MAYASSRERALIDRELYLPASWMDDRDRCRAAGIDDEICFATRNEHFGQMLQRAADAGVPFAWVTADETYGQVKHTRCWLEQRKATHVMATKVNDTVVTTGWAEARVDELIAALPRQRRKRLVSAQDQDATASETRRPDPDGVGHRTPAATSPCQCCCRNP
ncbi:transposase [Streptomyces pimonensis]|uniref:Transposase n=1 Tax=Streptomyces pimonensis TaxID=2860288 RepID=A0ABV4J4G3_9ACTN